MCLKYLKSSVGRKAVMAISGIFLFGFVIAHLLGNLQVFIGQEALNSYAQHLQELAFLLWPARVFLIAVLVVHIFVSISLAQENRKARPVRYKYQDTVQASYASRVMVMSGVLVFAFIIFHLAHFTFGLTHPQYFKLLDGKGRHDVYSMMVMSFRDWVVAGSYVIAMGFLCLHLSHGLSSMFQSLGLNNEKAMGKLNAGGKLLALFIFAGYISIPVAAFLNFIKLPNAGG